MHIIRWDTLMRENATNERFACIHVFIQLCYSEMLWESFKETAFRKYPITWQISMNWVSWNSRPVFATSQGFINHKGGITFKFFVQAIRRLSVRMVYIGERDSWKWGCWSRTFKLNTMLSSWQFVPFVLRSYCCCWQLWDNVSFFCFMFSTNRLSILFCFLTELRKERTSKSVDTFTWTHEIYTNILFLLSVLIFCG